jgi:serine phosphatase RsbU (regulator of sigma subunit)
MKIKQNNRKVENAFFVSVLLFVFKIIFPSANTFFLLLINEILILVTAYFWFIYVAEFVNPKLSKPLSLIVNAGLLNALLFFLMSASSWLFSGLKDSTDLIYVLFSSIIAFVFIGSLSYIFAVYKKLCFYRQKKNPILYFNIMLVFFVLTSLAASFFDSKGTVEGTAIVLDPNNNIIYNVLMTITVVLILLNSFRVAWIAFLNKKQKRNLLLLSIAIIIVSGMNEANENFTFIKSFSPALNQLLDLVMLYGVLYFIIVFFITLFHLPTAEVIDRKNEELSSFKDISKLMSQVFDTEELYETITSTALKVSNADASWLVINNKDNFNIHSVKGLGLIEAQSISDNLIKGKLVSTIEAKAIDTTELRKENNLLKDIYTIISAPLSIHNTNKGFLFAARRTSYQFEEEDSKSVSTFADFAAIALENSKLLEESIEKERLEKELDVAREVQYKLLPQKTPNYKNLDIAALFVPAFEVGGDYYDFFEIDDNQLGVVIADVSGKGIEAAFIMAEVKGIFSSLAKLNLTSKELLVKANLILAKSLPKKIFVTVTFGIINIKEKRFIFARAGHAPVLYATNNNVKQLVPQGIGLGLDFTEKFEKLLKEMEIKLNNNDIIILFTDGINETLNEHFEEFGYSRLEKIIMENKHLSSNQISKKIMESLSTFSENRSQHDDITLVILKWNNNNKKVGVN